ncbi:18091_t:CDS:2 [Rhizophagus irregularis]|nr:18091_t:CDS:2 [Rhizophagus irregularis]
MVADFTLAPWSSTGWKRCGRFNGGAAFIETHNLDSSYDNRFTHGSNEFRFMPQYNRTSIEQNIRKFIHKALHFRNYGAWSRVLLINDSITIGTQLGLPSNKSSFLNVLPPNATAFDHAPYTHSLALCRTHLNIQVYPLTPCRQRLVQQLKKNLKLSRADSTDVNASSNGNNNITVQDKRISIHNRSSRTRRADRPVITEDEIIVLDGPDPTTQPIYAPVYNSPRQSFQDSLGLMHSQLQKVPFIASGL